MKSFKTFITEAKATEEDEADSGAGHLVMHMRKSVSLRGNHNTVFKDGSKKKISQQDAQKFMQMHDRAGKPKDKEALVAYAHKSPKHFSDALSGKMKAERNPLDLPKLRSEEAEELDELSSKTLRNYVKKSEKVSSSQRTNPDNWNKQLQYQTIATRKANKQDRDAAAKKAADRKANPTMMDRIKRKLHGGGMLPKS